MEPGSALAHVHLMDEAGREVPRAFLALDQELWDPERRRLTLLFDPGRVKRGIRTNLESGAPLVAGRRYTLAIDDQWLDGTGTPIASGYRLAFEAVGADRRSPDPRRWRLAPPTAATRVPLRVAFGEPLDHALASRMVSVHDSSGRSLAGSAQIAESDSVWTSRRPRRGPPALIRCTSTARSRTWPATTSAGSSTSIDRRGTTHSTARPSGRSHFEFFGPRGGRNF